MSTIHHYIVSENDKGTRLDKFLSHSLSNISRSRIQSLIEGGHVTCTDATIAEASTKVKPGQRWSVEIPDAAPSHIEPQAMALAIVYEDDDLLVINKPSGLTVHPAPGHPDRTLVNALLAHCGESLSGIGGVARPGIVHRIDKDTSGLLVVAKNDAAHAALSAQLSERTLKRIYAALVWGRPKYKSGTITGNIGRSPRNRKKMAVVRTGGKEAMTHFEVLNVFSLPLRKGARGRGLFSVDNPPTLPSPARGEGFSLLECQLETGRTHQIRVHLTHEGHPLIGDPVYGATTKSRLAAIAARTLPDSVKQALLAFNRQALHAKEIGFIHPRTKKKMHFEIELPEDMQELIAALK